VAFSDEFLEASRQRLLAEEATIRAELADLGFGEDGSVDVHFDEGFADAAQTTSERGKALALSDGMKQRLDDIHAAMHRLERGTYGKCESCGNDIAEERLEAIPVARLCISCKQRSAQPIH
jgi:DnaK suppressor protein